jgi:hypothetical protein
MAGEAPVVYLLYGEDEFGIFASCPSICPLGDAATASMNTTCLDGSAISIDDLRATFACPSAPPPGDAPTLALNSKDLRKIHPPFEHRSQLPHWRLWSSTVSRMTIGRSTGPGKPARAAVRRFSIQRGYGPVDPGKAKQVGGQILPPRPRAGPSMLGTDTRTAYHEVQKLLAYVGYQRSVKWKTRP